MVKTMLEDEREIISVEGSGWMRAVGHNRVSRIVAYPENGDMAVVPWLAIFKKEDDDTEVIAERIDVRNTIIKYRIVESWIDKLGNDMIY